MKLQLTPSQGDLDIYKCIQHIAGEAGQKIDGITIREDSFTEELSVAIHLAQSGKETAPGLTPTCHIVVRSDTLLNGPFAVIDYLRAALPARLAKTRAEAEAQPA